MRKAWKVALYTWRDRPFSTYAAFPQVRVRKRLLPEQVPVVLAVEHVQRGSARGTHAQLRVLRLQVPRGVLPGVQQVRRPGSMPFACHIHRTRKFCLERQSFISINGRSAQEVFTLFGDCSYFLHSMRLSGQDHHLPGLPLPWKRGT